MLFNSFLSCDIVVALYLFFLDGVASTEAAKQQHRAHTLSESGDECSVGKPFQLVGHAARYRPMTIFDARMSLDDA